MEIFETVESNGHKHRDKDDLAVFSYQVDYSDHDLIGFSDPMITAQFIKDYDVGMGDEIFMMGRFVYHEGTMQNRPAVSFGNIAQMPDKDDPVRVTRTVKGQKEKFTQEAFLVELSSISGYSGSPVFLDISQSAHFDTKINEKRKIARPHKLLGVIAGHFRTNIAVENNDGMRLPNTQVQSSLGMAYAVPAWKLQELLDREELRNERAKVESESPGQ